MANEKEIMRVLRTPPLSKLVVDVGGKSYQSLADISDERVKQRVMAAIGELVAFAGGYKVLVDAGLAPPIVPAAPAPAPSEESLTPQQAEFIASLEAQRDAIKNAPPPKSRAAMLGLLKPPQLPESPQFAAAPSHKLSMAEEIDAILQQRLAADPALKDYFIHLEHNPAGGLRIRVNNTYYQEPKEIEDPRIQNLIRQAVAEWRSLDKKGG